MKENGGSVQSLPTPNRLTDLPFPRSVSSAIHRSGGEYSGDKRHVDQMATKCYFFLINDLDCFWVLL
jgi:hypothetical protein